MKKLGLIKNTFMLSRRMGYNKIHRLIKIDLAH